VVKGGGDLPGFVGAAEGCDFLIWLWISTWIWLWLWLWLLIWILILLLISRPFGRPSVGVHQGVRRAAPFGEAEHIERRS